MNFHVRVNSRSGSTFLATLLVFSGMACGRFAGEPAVRATYVGERRCAPCHREIHARWQASAHGRHGSVASPETVLGDFERDNVYVYRGVTSRMWRKDEKFFMETEGPEGVNQVYPVDLVLGCVQNQVYMTRFPNGRYQILPTYYDLKNNVWFDQTEGIVPSFGRKLTSRDTGFWAKRNRTWNSGCSGCHGSQVEKNYDASSGTYQTSWVDLSINCEACHGPGSVHVEAWTRAGPGGRVDAPEARFVDLKALAPDRLVDVCARCHAAKTTLDRDFLPGDSFLDHYQPAVPNTEQQFFSDGRNKGLNYTYISHIQSPCFLEGKLICTDCHDPHGSGRPIDLVVPEEKFNTLCTRCHENETVGSGGHTHHPPGSRGSQCVECHMPWMDVLGKKFQARDHSISVPVPAQTKHFGIPNSCNICHRDKDPDWSSRAIREWYGSDQEDRVRVTASFFYAYRRDPAAPAALLALFKDRSALVPARRAGIPMLLAAYQDPTLLAPLVPVMLDPKEEPLVRYQITAALAAVPGTLTDQALLKAILQPDDSLRRLAGVELARRGVRPRDPAIRKAIDEVIRDYERRVREVRADVPEDQAGLGDIYLKRGDEERALRQYQAALKLDPDQADIQIQLGTLYARLGQIEEAAACFRAAADLLPRNPVPRYDLGSLYLQAGRVSEALDHLNRALEIDPDHLEARFRLGMAQLESGDADSARENLQKFLTKRPRNPMAYYHLGRAQESSGRSGPAAEAYRKALEIAPNLIDARKALARLEGKDGGS